MKPDNIASINNSHQPKKRVSIVFNLISQCLLFLVLAFGVYTWLINVQFKLAMQQQSDALGQSLLTQTADRASELLAIDDKLGLNILLGSLAKNPLVADIAIFDNNGVELFRAGLKQFTRTSHDDEYKMPLVIQNQPKGELRLRLNRQQVQLPWLISTERAVIIGGVLLLIALIFTFRLGRKMTLPIIQLREWLRDPVMPVPATDQQDEIGDLARDLQHKLLTNEQIEAYYAQFVEPAPAVADSALPTETESVVNPSDELTDTNFDQSFFDEICNFNQAEMSLTDTSLPMPHNAEPITTEQAPVQTAILFIRLGGQEKLRLLPKERLINLLQRYRDCLDQTVRLYKGEIHTLSDGSSLVLFHGRGNDTETYLTHAICCGELMRGLSHELQVELADTNITLLLQIAIAQGTDLLGLTPKELIDNDTVQMVKSLADNSRNLLLMAQSIATDSRVASLAKVRALANPAGTYCIERVMEPYAEMLEKQLRNMRNCKL